tara:strand:+ start:282 stop:896 length:615 start_codon:yes stop_codon:yes gene_type:complete
MRVQSTRITANTNIMPYNTDGGLNPCTFNGIVISVIDRGSAAAGTIKVYNDQFGATLWPHTGTWDLVGKTFITAATNWKNKGYKVGDAITFASTSDGPGGGAANDGVKTITGISSTASPANYIVLELSAVGLALNPNDDAVTVQYQPDANLIFGTDFKFDESSPVTGEGEVTKTYIFTNGIFCKRGIRVEAESWTNLECFVLHS